MTFPFSIIAHGRVAFRGSYPACLDFAVDRGLAETERRRQAAIRRKA